MQLKLSSPKNFFKKSFSNSDRYVSMLKISLKKIYRISSFWTTFLKEVQSMIGISKSQNQNDKVANQKP